MKIKIEVTGETRNAAYLIDTDHRAFGRQYLNQTSQEEKVGETLKIRLKTMDHGSPFDLNDTWLVLKGRKEDIESTMLEEAPLSFFHLKDIYEALDRPTDDDWYFLTFAGLLPDNQVIARSRIYKTLRSSQVSIISDMYGITRDKVKLLRDVDIYN